jgi:DNA-binding transcriptional LysR family regulator
MPEPIDWPAIRTFVAVARTGSLSAGARALDTTQPTASRQIQRLEESVGGPLLVRHGRGVRLTPRGEKLLESAREVDAAMTTLERSLSGARTEPRGDVRVAASEFIGVDVIVPRLAELRSAYPHVVVELVLDNRASDLTVGEADIAVRLFAPEQLDLVATKIGEVSLGLYASRSYVAAHGMPRDLDDLIAHHALVGFDSRGPLAHGFERFDARLGPAAFALRTDSLEAHLMAARTGFGIAALQRPMAASFPELVDVLPALPPPSLPIWLTLHKDVRSGAHVRVTHDWLADVMRDYIAHPAAGWHASRGDGSA